MQNNIFDEKEISQSFAKSAQSYDSVAILQREIGKRLIERLDIIKIRPDKILDLGTGTGFCARLLEKRFRHSHLLAMDISIPMLAYAKQQVPWYGQTFFVGGSATHLPFPDHSIDLILSNLVLHWCTDLKQVFKEIRRVLAKDGLFLFSTLGPDTLCELRQSWKNVDTHQHVNYFMDMHDVGDALLEAELSDPVMDMEKITMTYPNVRQLMQELKLLGAHNLSANRNHGLTSIHRFEKMLDGYEQFRLQDGLYPASYEVIYGHAWQGVLAEGYRANENNEVIIPLNSLRRKR